MHAWAPLLRLRLQESGFTPDALQRLLHITTCDDVGVLNHAAALERIAPDPAPAALLTRLFFLENAAPARDVVAVLSPALCRQLVGAGVLRKRGDRLSARVRIDPVHQQYVVADRRFRSSDSSALHLSGKDPVYPPSSDSMLLRDAVVVPPGASVLDLCTGTGVQALQQADKADRIIAVDINPRAAAMARVNAELNGVPNVTVRVGDLYTPVRRGRLRERFDVIIANPPFVASPYAAAASYHSGGATGDRVLRRIIAGFDAHLSEGGRAFAITHLALRHGESVETVSARWFRSFPGRAVILVLETGTAVDLAAAQSLFALDRGLAAYGREVHRWVAYLRRHRIDCVTLLLLVAERGGHRALEVVDAQQRVLPIPLTRSPAERVREWLHAGNG